MAAFTSLSHSQIAEFLARFPPSVGGRLVSFETIAGGSVNSNFRLWTDGGPVFLRLYEEQGITGAQREAVLLAHLEAAGVPTPSPLAPNGTNAPRDRILELAGKPAALFPWRDGDMRCQKSVRASEAERVGAALARVHLVGAPSELLGDSGLGEGRFGPPALRERISRIAAAKNDTLAREASRLTAQLDSIEEARARRHEAPARGLVHGDVFRDNVLWRDDGEISAMLDFESASLGVFTYDLVVTILAWCFGDDLDLDLGAALVRGYTRVRPLEESEWRTLYDEARLAALRFTVTRITDYAMRASEGAPEHGPRVMKDWRRFAARTSSLKAIGAERLVAALRRSA